MKYFSVALIFLLMTFSSVQADMFDTANIPEHEKLSLTFSYKGIDLNHPDPTPYSVKYSAGESLLRAVYDTNFVGSGPGRHLESVITGTAHNGYTIQYLFKFKPGQKLILSYYEKTVLFPTGKKIRSEAYDFSESIPPLPTNMAHPYTFHLAARGLNFKPGIQNRFYVWFSPTQVFGIKLVVKGEETITVPAGKFTCYRLDMTPDYVDFAGAIMGRVLKPLLADYVLWVDKKAPHQLVKYQGPFGLINIAGGPSEIYELAKIGD
jgi:hypothetical protein